MSNTTRALPVVILPAAPANPLASSTTLVYKDSGAPVIDTKARDKQ